jgi:hypothetical protein
MEEHTVPAAFSAGVYGQPPAMFEQQMVNAGVNYGPANGDPAHQPFAVGTQQQMFEHNLHKSSDELLAHDC